MKTIYDFTKNGIELLKKIETTQEQEIMKEWIEISEIINKFPIKGLNKINSDNIHKEWEGLEFFNWDIKTVIHQNKLKSSSKNIIMNGKRLDPTGMMLTKKNYMRLVRFYPH